jgi:ferric-dicitrate binding protein FerR (iron transport regulator)
MLRRGVATLEERAAFESWLRDPDNTATISELERAWDAVGIAGDSVEAEASLARWNASRASAARVTLVAAVCVVSLALGALSYGGNTGFWTKLDWVAR